MHGEIRMVSYRNANTEWVAIIYSRHTEDWHGKKPEHWERIEEKTFQKLLKKLTELSTEGIDRILMYRIGQARAKMQIPIIPVESL